MIFCHNIHLEAEYPQIAIFRARISLCRPSQNPSTNLNPMKTSRTLTTSHLESRPVLAGIALILTLTVLSPTAHPIRFFSQVPSHK
jgi:hypothetical protein